jgi:hypothetical protein
MPGRRTLENAGPGIGLEFYASAVSSDKVEAVSVASQNDLTTMSLSCWFYMKGYGAGFGSLFAKGNGTVGQQRFAVESDSGVPNKMRFITKRGTQQGIWDFAVTLNQWNHLAITYDISSNSNIPVIKVNNSDVTPAATLTPSGTVYSDGTRLRIGAGHTSATGAFQGIIDDVRWYNKILTAAEITSLYGLSNVTDGLVGHWKFDENTGSNASDSVGGATGAITGAIWVTGYVGTPASRLPAGTRLPAETRLSL